VAILIIFPDEALETIRLEYNWRHLLWLELILIASTTVAVVILKRYYPNLRWFYPLMPLALAAIGRLLLRMINRAADDI
jgi:hypothetical protein